MTDERHRVIPKSKEKVRYNCGHVSWARFSHVLFGHEYTPQDFIFEMLEKCGDCLLEELTPRLAQCGRCKKPIFPQQDCILYKNELCCLSTECGPGPAFGLPGIWDGEKYVDGFEAGTIKVVSGWPDDDN